MRCRSARADLALCVGTESMSRNPIAAYTHRGGFRMGQVEFKDFLWEALLDPRRQCHAWATPRRISPGSTRSPAPRWTPMRRAASSAPCSAQKSGFLAGEIAPVKNESFELAGYQTARPQAQGREGACRRHPYPRPPRSRRSASIRPAFGGVQTGGNSSAIVDGAAAALVGSADYVKASGKAPLARIVAGAAVGVPPEIMGIGPVPAIRAVLDAPA